MNDPDLRTERRQDFGPIHDLHVEAFGPGSPEADLVDALREAGSHVADLCLVALHNERVVGHVFFTDAVTVCLLEPEARVVRGMSDHDDQREVGVARKTNALAQQRGSDAGPLELGQHCHRREREHRVAGVQRGLGAPWEVPPEAWMVHRLPAYRPEARGLVRYADAFDAVS